MGYNRTLGHFTNSQELATIWASGQNYIVNQLVLDNNKLYRCITAHTSGATFAGDSAYWSGVNPGATISIAEGGTGQTTKTEAFDALAPTTTAGDLIVYNGTDNVRLPVGTDGQMIVADASQINKLKWATVPQGSKNYITYSNFENNATTGWSLFNTTLTGKIPTGSILAGAGSLNALAVSSSTPLAGSYSLSVTSPGAVAAGQGFITDVLTIDREDQAKVLTFSFYYETVSGTMDFSGTSANTWAIYIHDGTSWIQPAGVYGMTQSSGTGLVTGTFQTNATGTSYRLAVVCITATGAAISMKFDDFKLSPQTAPIGPVMTDFQSYTATTSGFNIGTTGTATTRWRRVGDSIHVIGRYVAGGAGISVSGDLRVFLPTGLSFDTSKISITSTIGAFELHNAGAYRYGGATLAVDTTQVAFSIRQNAATLGNFAGTGTPEVGWFNAGNDEISFEFMAPISGWSSNVQTSDSTDTRVVAFAANKTAAQSIPNNSYTVIDFNSVEINTHGSTYAAGAYTAPVSGYYRVGFNFNFASGSGGTIFALLNKNGAGFARVSTQSYSTPQAGGTGSTVLYLNAGDNVSLSVIQLSGSAQNLEGAGRFSVERISGPSVVAANQVIAFSAYDGGSVAVTNTTSLLPMGTTDIDTHAVRSGQTYVIPVSGFYRISAKSTSKFSAGNIANNHALLIYKNGSPQSGGDYGNADAANGSGLEFFFLSVNSIFRLNAGDIIDFRYYTNYLGVATTYLKYCAVERLGGTG